MHLTTETKANAAADFLAKRLSRSPRVGMVLGSGLGLLGEEIETAIAIPYGEIPHFPLSKVPGHQGTLIGGHLCGQPVAALSGRVHLYEGHPAAVVAFPMRVLAALGVETVIITAAVGCLNPAYAPGDILALSDHINLMGTNPLRGGPHFVDLTPLYDATLRRMAINVAAAQGVSLGEGVYAAMPGPCYETPAEVRALRALGADVVGMSTVPEAIMAYSLGVRVLVLALVTNMAAGITKAPLSHEEVVAASEKGGRRFRALVRGILSALGDAPP
ncbi:MAG: purine-nucleoside phosphorylase [Desulfosarcinaceae bacterium]|jgi:purine-nucleoside phosphorylase